jgi:S-adenosylmethionine-diacylgycerolhomoserine-N-methlytransferase
MDPSTSPAGPPEPSPEAGGDGFARFQVGRLARFYAWNAPIYDLTRPFILYGRRALLDGLSLRGGEHVLDVGCGTGWGTARLASRGARVTAIDCSPAMLVQARRRVARLGPAAARVSFDARPYGSHGDYAGRADAVVFSYSLSMIPPSEETLAQARRDLKPGGCLAVVDFLDAAPLADRWLAANHVHLGPARLDNLRRLCPDARLEVRRAGAWRYYLFWGIVV